MVEDNTGGDSELTDEEVLEKALDAENSRKFELRYSSGYDSTALQRRYDNRRQAEVALLANLAFWTRHDREQMWRLFEGSELYRPEIRDYSEYRREILDSAVDMVDESYDPDYERNT